MYWATFQEYLYNQMSSNGEREFPHSKRTGLLVALKEMECLPLKLNAGVLTVLYQN